MYIYFSRDDFWSSQISLNQAEWGDLLSNSVTVNKYFEGGSTGLKPFELGSLNAAFQTVYGKQTLVKEPRSPWSVLTRHHSYSRSYLENIMAAKNCITQALEDSAVLSAKALQRFEDLASILRDHLRAQLTDETQDDYDALTTTTSNFLSGLNFYRLKSFDPSNNMLCYNLCLFSLPLFVSHFKINTFYKNFNPEA